jgi:solute carrier family 32 (vesicular inhibitory amino acid transporter)
MGTFTLLISVLIDSLVKAEYPGSIRDPAPTSLGPMWSQLPLSFGLLLAGFSGHAVVPSLARDMAEPERFDSVSHTEILILVMRLRC